MSTSAFRSLIINGIPHIDGDGIPPVSTFLETTSGAYTTTRTHANASVILFRDRHLHRLAHSARLLAEARSVDRFSPSLTALLPLVEDSLCAGLPAAVKERRDGEELAITTLVSGRRAEVDVYVHIGMYVPQAFGIGARLAVAGPGRELAQAKHSEWVRTRKGMERLRPPQATELLLSNDGDRILEGSVTNFFVVSSLGVQTAPVADGVLPGVIRQVVIEICEELGIPTREVAPSWSDREFWEEAFVTNSLRLLQHVEVIQAPVSWGDLRLGSWEDVSWVEKRFEDPGPLTSKIYQRLLERAWDEGYPLSSFI